MDRSWLRIVISSKEHRWTRPGATRERDKLLLMAGKQSFVEPLFLNLMPGIHISKNLLSLL